MILSDVIFGLLIILGLMACITAYWLLAFALFPAFVARCETRYRERFWRNLLAGAVFTGPALVLAAALLQAPAGGGRALGLAFFFGLILAGLAGSAGLASLVGKGLQSSRDETEPWRRMLRGGVVLTLVFVLPGVGWFVALPVVMIGGAGAWVSDRLPFARRTRPAETANQAEAVGA